MEKTTCTNDAVFRYTWPGKDESFICLEHSIQLRGIANALGLYLQLIPIPPGLEKCHQIIEKKSDQS